MYMNIKANFISAALVFTLGLLPFASCNKNNPQDQNEEDAEEEIVESSDASYFVSQFVTLQNDESVLYLKGYRMNEADDTEFTFITETWEDAKSLFLGWLPTEAKPNVSDNSVSWEMYDAQGQSQGTIVLNKKENGGLVAEAKVPVNNPYVRTLRFVPLSSLGTNSEDAWLAYLNELLGRKNIDDGDEDYDFSPDDELLMELFFGNVIALDEDPSGIGYPTGNYIVLREYDPFTNEKGILIHIDKAYHFYKDNVSEVKARLRTQDEVRTCSKIFVENKDFLEPLMKDADGNFIVGNYTANVACKRYQKADFWNAAGWKVAKVKFDEDKNSNDVVAGYPNANEICLLYFSLSVLNAQREPFLVWE